MLISFWKTARGVSQPKRYPVKLECSFGTWEDCFSLLGLFKFTCQYPPLKSSAVNSLHVSLPSKQRLILINSNRKKQVSKRCFFAHPLLIRTSFLLLLEEMTNEAVIIPQYFRSSSLLLLFRLFVLFWEYSLLDNDMQFLTSSSQYKSLYDECLS